MERIKSHSLWMERVLIAVGAIALFFLFIVNIAYYKYDIDVSPKAITTACITGGSFLYMAYEYFRTMRMFEELEARMKELENSNDIH